ncbi:MAG: NUDIX domain-containing protein [Anaerolineae bacterium]|nr:NUDIX domain-containing protein [Anaerolineae bacterium]
MEASGGRPAGLEDESQACYRLRIGAGALVVRDRALLLVQRRGDAPAFPGTWNLPAGYCEADETPAAAAIREAQEETGLRVRPGRLAGAYYFDDDPRGSGLLIVYEAAIVGGALRTGGPEVRDSGFFQPGALPEPLCGGGHDQAIRAWEARALDRWQPDSEIRYCPHCAHPVEEREAFGRTRHVCPACGYVHFRSPKLGVSIMVEQEGQILLVQRAIEPGLGKWSLPSGFMEWDEAPEVAAVRECAEETGLVVDHLELVTVDHYDDDFRGPGLNLTYRGQVASGTLRPADDAASVRFFAPEGLPSLEGVAFQSHRRLLERWLQDGRQGTPCLPSAPA